MAVDRSRARRPRRGRRRQADRALAITRRTSLHAVRRAARHHGHRAARRLRRRAADRRVARRAARRRRRPDRGGSIAVGAGPRAAVLDARADAVRRARSPRTSPSPGRSRSRCWLATLHGPLPHGLRLADPGCSTRRRTSCSRPCGSSPCTTSSTRRPPATWSTSSRTRGRAGTCPRSCRCMLDRILDFPNRDVEHAMIPRPRVGTVSCTPTHARARSRELMAQGHSRYPVLDGRKR